MTKAMTFLFLRKVFHSNPRDSHCFYLSMFSVYNHHHYHLKTFSCNRSSLVCVLHFWWFDGTSSIILPHSSYQEFTLRTCSANSYYDVTCVQEFFRFVCFLSSSTGFGHSSLHPTYIASKSLFSICLAFTHIAIGSIQMSRQTVSS